MKFINYADGGREIELGHDEAERIATALQRECLEATKTIESYNGKTELSIDEAIQIKIAHAVLCAAGRVLEFAHSTVEVEFPDVPAATGKVN